MESPINNNDGKHSLRFEGSKSSGATRSTTAPDIMSDDSSAPNVFGHKNHCNHVQNRAYLAVLLLFISIESALPFSLDLDRSRRTITRRDVLSFVLGTATSLLLVNNNFANATCITGDESADCIGVYKESMPDGGGSTVVTQSYGVFRPQRAPIILTNPQSLNEAVGMLQDQLLAMAEVERLISSGDMENAGITFLRVLPRLILAGKYIVAAKQGTVPQIQQMSDEVITLAIAVDNHIGKALHGNLGSTTTIAQLTLLSDAKAVKVSLTNFIERATS